MWPQEGERSKAGAVGDRTLAQASGGACRMGHIHLGVGHPDFVGMDDDLDGKCLRLEDGLSTNRTDWLGACLLASGLPVPWAPQ